MIDDKFNCENNILDHNPSKNQASINEEKTQRLNELKFFSDKSELFRIILVIGIILSLAISGIGIALAVTSPITTALYLSIFGFISAIILSFGIYVSYQYANKCNEYIADQDFLSLEEVDQSDEQKLLFKFIYSVIVIFIVLIVFSTNCFSFNDTRKIEFKAISENTNKWQSNFGDKSFREVVNYTAAMLYSAGCVCVLIMILISILLFLTFRMLGVYRTWQKLVRFIFVMFFFLGLIFLYLSLYSNRYTFVVSFQKSMPVWIIYGLVSVGSISIFLALFGFLSSFYKNICSLQIFTIFVGIFILVVLVFAALGITYSDTFKSLFEDRCSLLLDYIHEDYLQNFIGCERKYDDTNENMDNLVCPKESIVTAWEKDSNNGRTFGNKSTYGCLDKGCCYKTYVFIKSVENYVVIIAFPFFLLSCLLFAGSWNMSMELTNDLEINGETNEEIDWSSGLIGLFVFVILVVMLGFIPNEPNTDPVAAVNIKISPLNNTQVDVNLVTEPDMELKLNENYKKMSDELLSLTQIQEDKSKCGNSCPTLRFNYELTSNDGIFQMVANNSRINMIKNEQQGSGWNVTFYTNDVYLQDFTEYFRFIHNCRLNPSAIFVRVSARVYQFDKNYNSTNDSSNSSFIQMKLKNRLKYPAIQNKKISSFINSLNSHSEVPMIDYSILRENQNYDILDKKINFSYVDADKFQIVSGTVKEMDNLNSTLPVKSGIIKIMPIGFPDCNLKSLSSDENGDFKTDKLYVMNGNIPIKYKLEIKAEGFESYERNFIIGGIGWVEQLILLDILLTNRHTYQESTLISTVVNSLNNEKLDGVKVSIWKGFKDYDNELDIKLNQKSTFLQLGQDNQSNHSNIASNKFYKNNNGKSQYNHTTLISSTMTDKLGKFSFSGLLSDTYTLIFEKNGFFKETECKISYFINHFTIDIHIYPNDTNVISKFPMTPHVNPGQIRFVLSWQSGPKDLDIYSLFRITKNSRCEVYFGRKQCIGTELNTDSFKDESHGVEVITINTLGKYIYTIAVHNFIQNNIDSYPTMDNKSNDGKNDNSLEDSTNINELNTNIPLSQSEAKILIYIYGYKEAIYKLDVPRVQREEMNLGEQDNNLKWWWAFCIDGNKGMNDFVPINILTRDKPTNENCEVLLGKKYIDEMKEEIKSVN